MTAQSKDIVAAGHEGLTGPSDATLRVVEFGLDMLDAIKSTRCPDGIQLQMRLGIHTGSCYSGVVGMKGELMTLFSFIISISMSSSRGVSWISSSQVYIFRGYCQHCC